MLQTEWGEIQTPNHLQVRRHDMFARTFCRAMHVYMGTLLGASRQQCPAATATATAQDDDRQTDRQHHRARTRHGAGKHSTARCGQSTNGHAAADEQAGTGEHPAASPPHKTNQRHPSLHLCPSPVHNVPATQRACQAHRTAAHRGHQARSAAGVRGGRLQGSLLGCRCSK